MEVMIRRDILNWDRMLENIKYVVEDDTIQQKV